MYHSAKRTIQTSPIKVRNLSPTYLPHLPSIPSDSYWASTCLAVLPDIPSLICDFCPSDQRFAIRLPSDSTSRWAPLPLAVSFPLSGHFTDLHRLDYAHAGGTRMKDMCRIAHAFSFYSYKFSISAISEKLINKPS